MRRIYIPLFILVLAVCLAGCELLDFGQTVRVGRFYADWYEYQRENHDRPEHAEEYVAQVKAMNEVEDVLSNFIAADILVARGKVGCKSDYIEQAIRLRPGDWTYRSALAGVYLSEGNLEGYQRELDKSFDEGIAGNADKARICQQNINDLKLSETTILGSGGFNSAEQCRKLYTGLSLTYKYLDQFNGDTQHALELEQAEARLAECAD